MRNIFLAMVRSAVVKIFTKQARSKKPCEVVAKEETALVPFRTEAKGGCSLLSCQDIDEVGRQERSVGVYGPYAFVENEIVGCIVNCFDEQIPIGKYVDCKNGVRVRCINLLEKPVYNSGDYFIKKECYDYDTNELLAKQTEYINRAQIKGMIKGGVFSPVISFF